MDPFDRYATPPWPSDALCTQVGYGDLWFPEKGGNPRAAKDTCLRCPIITDCLTYALENPEHGIWGSTSAIEREVLAGRRRSSGKTGRDRIIARLAKAGVDVEQILQQEAAA